MMHFGFALMGLALLFALSLVVGLIFVPGPHQTDPSHPFHDLVVKGYAGAVLVLMLGVLLALVGARV